MYATRYALPPMTLKTACGSPAQQKHKSTFRYDQHVAVLHNTSSRELQLALHTMPVEVYAVNTLADITDVIPAKDKNYTHRVLREVHKQL